MFGGYKLGSLFSQSEYKIQVRVEENYFNQTDQFGYDDEFYIAGGISSYDGNSGGDI